MQAPPPPHRACPVLHVAPVHPQTDGVMQRRQFRGEFGTIGGWKTDRGSVSVVLKLFGLRSPLGS